MSVARLRDLLAGALSGGWCLGYFEAWDVPTLEASLEAAEETHSPAIIGFGAAVAAGEWLDRRGVDLLASAARRLAESARTPCAVLFNEGQHMEQVRRALGAGCNALMLDSSHLPFDENLAATRRVVELATASGADVEAELGRLADGRTPGDHGEPTDPLLARRFVRESGVSCLAVSAGGAHVLLDRTVSLDLDRIGAVAEGAGVPLVLHGGSSIPDSVVAAAARRGVAKINYGSRLKRLYLQGLRESLEAAAGESDVHRLVGFHGATDVTSRGLALVKAEVARLLGVYGASGRAS